MSGEQAEERTAREGREQTGEALQWLLDEKYHDDAAHELAPDFAKYAAFYAESECSRLASRVEELEKALQVIVDDGCDFCYSIAIRALQNGAGAHAEEKE